MQAEHWDGTHRGFALPSGANSGPLSSLSTLLPGTWSPLSWGAFLDVTRSCFGTFKRPLNASVPLMTLLQTPTNRTLSLRGLTGRN